MLRTNQVNAITKSIENGFESGVHFHCTGSGKSWIALQLILEYNNVNPKKHILWICEHKSILTEQFNKDTIKLRGYEEVYKKFMVIDYAAKKSQNWYECVNSASFWGKSILLIINRAFLVSGDKYKNLCIPVGLIIHDECHSISNNTTKKFYNYLLVDKPKLNTNTKYLIPSCIGFSATPLLNSNMNGPFKNILSKYTIYDAYNDGVVVKPVIKWINTESKLSHIEIIKVFKSDILKLPYRKVVIWCGMIENCYKLAKLWSLIFKDFLICVDTSDEINNNKYGNYEEFCKAEYNAFMFCACKHREGSDIMNLDCCIFLDRVRERSSRTFVQCVGRVLRLDKNNYKTYGMIIDVRAKSPIEVCDRMNGYLNTGNRLFPWDYKFSHMSINNKKLVKVNTLSLKKVLSENSNINNTKPKIDIEELVTEEDLIKKFVRKIPDDKQYYERLKHEMKMIIGKNLGHNIILALEILEMTKDIPHVTRGSCGSSLVCYLLGISHVDPIKYKISFARFLNEYRNNLPDIDFDFPHMLRDEVFLKLQLKWPGMVARISNHVHYHEKSAIRQSMRNNGIKGFIGKYEIGQKLMELSPQLRNKVEIEAKEMDNKFRGYSLHCGGIVFFGNGVPEELKLMNKDNIISQVILNKEDVARDKNFKIDILSSRALSQLYMVNKYGSIDFLANANDIETANLLSNGDNIGITLAESPLMRKAMLKLKPKCIDDVAACLAIIRPTAKDARDALIPEQVDLDNHLVYDDDAIKIISKMLECSEDEADMYRRAFAKGDKKKIEELKKSIPNNKNKKDILKVLNNLRKYGFCKAHAYSYAQLVWQLAYHKAHNPVLFWRAALKNCESYYRRWVHVYEAKRVGVKIENIIDDKDISIYAEARKKEQQNRINNQKSNEEFNKALFEMNERGYWDMTDGKFFPNCYYFIKDKKVFYNGIIASSRILSHDKDYKTTSCVLFIGVSSGKYIEVMLQGKIPNIVKKIGIKGNGEYNDKVSNTVSSNSFVFY